MKNWLSIKEAREIVRKEAKKYNINNANKWRWYCSSGKRLKNIPSAPDVVYKNKGWISWGNWLGSNNVATKNREFLPFNDARKIIVREAKKYGINSRDDWQNHYINENKIAINIPCRPCSVYKNKGWVSWGNWLGTENVRGQPRKHEVNDDFFKTWSHDMSYVLGFWFADGYMITRGRYIFSIAQKDKHLLKKILMVMSSNYPLYRSVKKNNYSFVISSQTICNDILRLGGIPKKSLTLKFPIVPKKYLPDFIRGLWDGDGSFSLRKNYQKQNSLNASFVSGSRDFIVGFMKVIKRNIPKVNPKFYVDRTKKHSVYYRFRFNSADAIRFGNFIYKGTNILKMNRKFKLYKMAGV